MAALEMLATDAFDPRLQTHKLSGELEGSFASAGYDLRIIFSLVQHTLLEAGIHDEVY